MKFLNDYLIAESRGWTAKRCPDCGCLRAFLVLDAQVVWLDYHKESFCADSGSWVYRCSFCLHEHLLGTLARTDKRWQQDHDLAKLIERTGSDDPAAEIAQEREPRHLLALLHGLNYQVKRTRPRDAGLGYVEGAKKGALLGLAAGFVIVAAMALESENFNPVTPLLGMCVAGVILGSPLGYRRKLNVLHKQLFQRELTEICQQRGITKEELLGACKGRGRRFRRQVMRLEVS